MHAALDELLLMCRPHINIHTHKQDDKSSKHSKHKQATTTGRGVGVKLYTDFYHSDILLASPLGMHLATTTRNGASQEQEENDPEELDEGGNGSEDCDFLSSIEVRYIQ
jgi:adenylosuccinate synthase